MSYQVAWTDAEGLCVVAEWDGNPRQAHSRSVQKMKQIVNSESCNGPYKVSLSRTVNHPDGGVGVVEIATGIEDVQEMIEAITEARS